jgi:hypothetical protein
MSTIPLDRQFTALPQKSPNKGGWTYVVMQFPLDPQLVPAVAEGHEGAAEGMVIDGPRTLTSPRVPKYSADPGSARCDSRPTNQSTAVLVHRR